MEIIYKKVDELIPYEKNPRLNDEAVKYVANSIKEFGFKVPMVIDKNGTIVAGHTRYKASLELGLKEVPCIIADDLSEEQIKAYTLAHNKLTMGDREPIQTMNLTFSDDQVEVVKDAINKMKQTEKYKNYVGINQNSNGNALYLVVEEWLQQKM